MTVLKNLFETLVDPKIKQHVLFITKRYMDAGFECWIVGGPTRDLLLGGKPKDIDFATNCPLEQTKSLFNSVIPTGEDHGTLTIHLDGENYEVTRYRKDIDTDGRRATIEFADTIEEDVTRRDLTVNAIAFNAITGEVVDAVGGLADIEKRVLRFVGNTKDRILEDHLRFIRLLRFKLRLGFEVESTAIDDARSVFDVTKLSLERIYDEFTKIFKFDLTEADCKFIEDALKDKMDFDFIVHDNEKSNRIVHDIFQLKSLFPIVYWNSWKPEYRLGTEFRRFLSIFEKAKTYPEFVHRNEIKSMLNFSDGNVELFTMVLKYHQYYFSSNFDKNVAILYDIVAKNEPFSIKDLKINGNDLMKLGYAGINIKKVLDACLKIVYNSPEKNTHDFLIDYAADNLNMHFLA